MSAASLAGKFRGCLLGSHVGDCMGAPFETEVGGPIAKSVLSKFVTQWLSSITDKGPVLEQHYTDDTCMTLCMAKSLVENDGFNAKDLAKKFLEEYKKPNCYLRGYGNHVRAVFAAWNSNECSDVLTPAKLQFGGSGSFGNGSAMRIAPVALYCYNKEDALVQLATDTSLLTHTHQNGYNGAILQCLAIHQALKTDSAIKIDPVAFLDNLIKKIEEIEKPLNKVSHFEDKQPYYTSLKKIRDIFSSSKSVTPESIANNLGNGVAAHKSVPAAIYSFLKSLKPIEDFESDNPFVRTMYTAISIGGDTDTIAAMAGSIAGAYHGVDAIPKGFLSRCETVAKSEQAADELFQLCCG